MNYLERALSILLVAYFAVSAIGCSAEENSSRKAQGDAGVFQGYRDSMDKAENVERVIMQADKNRREEMEKNY
ncbi:MAG: hypothetical protein B6D72_05090 [gamma proteobacterium symbiont of Ctena orbiculata]|uniref:Uncharacterized protein n=1 Tax=Candidatus Thiodiazotropha taylori TaxID=2792791 RepID=A0A944QUK5_9GAMM|nr:hypothetical protein [Candidatus Thiodiazotropha taylori]PUB88699.1 MAG: hypothetical protein DBP00_04760 [gamma proteobacterium symbiont of Ctena orbiculata]MBT2991188.1 hypothetical protein [Candidatus Thiodiazotropha taylori]MBT2998803.1 hypothetical protein [Candidatus Thiodiazotropha taylori]MBT3002321.1 hypothetical protein [Candidatus Thiodiazotropha taylori]